MAEAQKDDENGTRSILSMCDVMRDNTNEIIVKIESLLPSHIEDFTNLQSEYLRISRDFFGTCYIAEKEFLDKIGVDQKTIIGVDKYLKIMGKTTMLEIDMINNWQKAFINGLITTMNVFDDYIKNTLSSYAKTLGYVSSKIPSQNRQIQN